MTTRETISKDRAADLLWTTAANNAPAEIGVVGARTENCVLETALAVVQSAVRIVFIDHNGNRSLEITTPSGAKHGLYLCLDAPAINPWEK